jgi:hypothetical protein
MDTDAEKLGGGECTARAAAGDGGAADAAAGPVKEVQHVRRRGMGEQQLVRRKRRDVRQRSSNLSPAKSSIRRRLRTSFRAAFVCLRARDRFGPAFHHKRRVIAALST